MNTKTYLAFGLTLCATSLMAQAPDLRVTPVVRPGEPVDLILTGPPLAPYATLFDFGGGPVAVLGETFYLGFGPGLGVFDSGTIGFGGFRTAQISTGSGPIGIPLYLQSVVLDPSRPMGLAASDGESTSIANAPHLIVADITDPIAQGFTGTFDPRSQGRILAAAPRTRTQNVPPPTGIEFGQPLYGPLNPLGVRQQSVFRASDLGATGEPELLVGVRWMPFPGGTVALDVLHNIAIDVSHSHVVPDYTIDPWSALPAYPNSGLGLLLAANVPAGETPQRVFQGDYTIDPSLRQRDGYMPFPTMRPFAYDGTRSLLLDFFTPPDPAANGRNGMRVFLMVQTSPQPNSRAYTAGGPITGTVNPYGVTIARQGDNTYPDMQFEFVRVESVAQSPWITAPVPSPRYAAPVISSSVPPGAAVRVEYRGSNDSTGQPPTAWSSSVGIADGHRYLQYRIHLTVGPGSTARPSVDQIVFPVF